LRAPNPIKIYSTGFHCICALLFLALPAIVRAQFTFTTNNGAITITGYTGSGGVVVIPSATNGYPVNSIGTAAFDLRSSMTSLTIPDSVTNIGTAAFAGTTGLTNISVAGDNPAFISTNGVLFDKAQKILMQYPAGLTNDVYIIPGTVRTVGVTAFFGAANLTTMSIPAGVTNIGAEGFFECYGLRSIGIPGSVVTLGEYAFESCTNLTSVSIPSSVVNIGYEAFNSCTSLTNVTVPGTATNIASDAFSDCTKLKAAYFEGNAPPDQGAAFSSDPATVYYLPGTAGWGTTYGSVPTKPWYQPQPTILNFEPSFGLHNHQFGFTISWATNTSVIVQASTNFSGPGWVPVTTDVLSNGTNYFGDPSWTSYPSRFYRVSSQ